MASSNGEGFKLWIEQKLSSQLGTYLGHNMVYPFQEVRAWKFIFNNHQQASISYAFEGLVLLKVLCGQLRIATTDLEHYLEEDRKDL